jgi:hypothetical protein
MKLATAFAVSVALISLASLRTFEWTVGAWILSLLILLLAALTTARFQRQPFPAVLMAVGLTMCCVGLGFFIALVAISRGARPETPGPDPAQGYAFALGLVGMPAFITGIVLVTMSLVSTKRY